MSKQDNNIQQINDSDLENIRKYLEKLIGVKVRNRKIKAIGIRSKYRWQSDMYVEVGKYYSNLEPNSPKEQVTAIFESTVFCVCTPERGMLKGLPYLFSREDVYKVEDM